MSSKVIVPVADFAAFITRLEELERKLAERLVDGVYKYGPCLRCGYGPWDSSSAHEPRCCPRCHSAYWDRPPRKPSARRPEDPPLPGWRNSRQPKKRAVFVTPEPVVEAPLQSNTGFTRPSVVLPPELRPPGEPLIPPPPRIEGVGFPASTSATPIVSTQATEIVTPTEHVAVLPDAVVESILAGQDVGYEDIKAAKAAKEASDARIEITDVPESRVREDVPETPARPVDASLQAKKDAFFTDAITAGLVSPVVEGAPAPDSTPFVTPADAPSLAPPADDDPFWK